MKVPANRTNPFNKWQQSFPKRNNSTVQASFDWLAISKQCQNNYMDAWIGILATLHHDPSHHSLSPAPATGLLQRLRCCSSRLKSSVCDFFLLTLHWFLASSMETPSVIETEWYQLEVKCFDSKKKCFTATRIPGISLHEKAHKPQLSEARNHASVLRNGAPHLWWFSRYPDIGMWMGKMGKEGVLPEGGNLANYYWLVVSAQITLQMDRHALSGHLTQSLHTVAPHVMAI